MPTYGQWKRCLKIISETALPPKKNYRSADSAYAILIKEYATDSLKYASFRINRALNMALMTDNIAVLKEEVELAKKIFPETWKGLDTNVYGEKTKKTFSTNALTSAKSNPACYIKKITKSLQFERTDL